MNQSHRRAYVVKRFRIEGEPNYVQLEFKTQIELKEDYLQRMVKIQKKNPYPHRMEIFLKYMSDQCSNVDNCKVNTIQVYMNNRPESLDNYYLSSMFFTTGLRSVAAGQKHCIVNFRVGMPIYIAKCRSNLPTYRPWVNTLKVLVNDALIRDDFEICDIKQYWTVDEHSIYFLYTVAHSSFLIASMPITSGPVFDASSVCEVQMENLSDPHTSSTADTPCTQPANSPNMPSPNPPNMPSPNPPNMPSPNPPSAPSAYSPIELARYPPAMLWKNFPTMPLANSARVSVSPEPSTSAGVGHPHKLEEQINQLNAKIDELEERLQEYEDETQRLRTLLEYRETELESTRRKNRNLVERSQEANQKLINAMKELDHMCNFDGKR